MYFTNNYDILFPYFNFSQIYLWEFSPKGGVFIKSLSNSLKLFSVKTQMSIVFLAIFLPLYILSSVILFRSYYLRLNNDLTQTMNTSLSKTGSHFSILLDDVENISRSVLYNSDVQNTLRASNKSDEDYTAYENATEFIYSTILFRNYIQGIAIIDQAEAVFSLGEIYTNDASFYDKTWYHDELYTEQPFSWINENPSNNSVLLTRQIKDNQDFITVLGKMAIYLDSKYINDFIRENSMSENSCIFLLQPTGDVLFSSSNYSEYNGILDRIENSTELSNSSEIVSINHTKYLVGMHQLEKDDWRLIEIVPYKDLNHAFISYGFLLVFSIILVLVMFLAIIFYITRTISSPIQELTKFMDTYNLLEDTIPESYIASYSSRKDEAGIIFKAYLRSINRTRELVNEVYVKDIQKKNAELTVLEHQIHPHFLYNTLDSINWLALKNHQDEISDMITALSNTFRISLRKTNSPYVTVSDELEHIRLYLVTLEHRYGDNFFYYISVPEEILHLYMMRLTLQPLIENAILHGIEPMQQNSIINITAHTQQGKLILIIENTCRELDLEKINLLLSDNIEGDFIRLKMQHGYGINNINNRIHLLHGKEYGIFYSFNPPNICHCEVHLPIITQADYEQLLNNYDKEGEIKK